MKILRGESAIDGTPLDGCVVGVLGFGNQGRAHALNMRDSGCRVIVGARRDSKTFDAARELDLNVLTIREAAARADLAIIALPDEVHGEVFDSSIAPALRHGAVVGFLHGFSIRFDFVKPRPDLGVVLVAPKGPGTSLRERYVEGSGIPCLFAVHQDSAEQSAEPIGLAWARAIGCARAGVLYTTFAAETETDLFGEQAVLCGGLPALITAAFETLVQAGYDPELAYIECCHEVKQIADLIFERGLAGMRQAISNTAEFGEERAAAAIVDEQARLKMRGLLDDIRSGRFASEFQRDHAAGFAAFHQRRAALTHHPIEDAGRVVRSLIPCSSSRGAAAPRAAVEPTSPDCR